MEFQSSEKPSLPSHCLDPIADENGNVRVQDFMTFLLDRHDYLHQMTHSQILGHSKNVSQTETHMIRSAKAFGFTIRGVDGRAIDRVELHLIRCQPVFEFYDQHGVPIHANALQNWN